VLASLAAKNKIPEGFDVRSMAISLYVPVSSIIEMYFLVHVGFLTCSGAGGKV
jgi:hypothetical protein